MSDQERCNRCGMETDHIRSGLCSYCYSSEESDRRWEEDDEDRRKADEDDAKRRKRDEEDD